LRAGYCRFSGAFTVYVLGTYINALRTEHFLPGATEETVADSGNYLYYSTYCVKGYNTCILTKTMNLSPNSVFQNVFYSFVSFGLVL